MVGSVCSSYPLLIWASLSLPAYSYMHFVEQCGPDFYLTLQMTSMSRSLNNGIQLRLFQLRRVVLMTFT
eukprot:5848370-Pyramimonas_sp.AAC.1